jgi:hypothetical protein
LLRERGAAGSIGAAGPGPSCHTLQSMLFCVGEVLAIAQVGSSLICGSFDSSEDNPVLWIEPTTILRSRLLAALFLWMTEAL